MAALRIAVALCWLTLWEVRAAPALAAAVPTSAPVGIGWLPLHPGLAWVAELGVLVGAVLGLLGVHARLGFTLVAVCGFYVLAIPQLTGAVQHVHHLWWFAVLLACSPASDALSLRPPRPAPGRSLAWGVPTHLAFAVLACIYFFPGVHKLRVQGLDWAGDNLVRLLHWKWAQSPDFAPLTRLDEAPTLLWLGGLAVLAFELTAPLWMLTRASRAAFAALALAFHVATALWFDIHFGILAACLVVLLPWPEPGARHPADGARHPADGARHPMGGARHPMGGARHPLLPAAMAGSALLAGIVGFGAAGITQGYPFACYPSFDQPHAAWMPYVQVLAVDAEGRERALDAELLVPPGQGQRFVREVWAMQGLYGPLDPAAVEAFWRGCAARPEVAAALGEAVEVRVHAARIAVDPDDRRIERGQLLGRFTR